MLGEPGRWFKEAPCICGASLLFTPRSFAFHHFCPRQVNRTYGVFDMAVAVEICVSEGPEGTEVTANNGETENGDKTESILVRSFSVPPLLPVFSAISAFSFLTRVLVRPSRIALAAPLGSAIPQQLNRSWIGRSVSIERLLNTTIVSLRRTGRPPLFVVVSRPTPDASLD
jgi:hypothetical protein